MAAWKVPNGKNGGVNISFHLSLRPNEVFQQKRRTSGNGKCRSSLPDWFERMKRYQTSFRPKNAIRGIGKGNGVPHVKKQTKKHLFYPFLLFLGHLLSLKKQSYSDIVDKCKTFRNTYKPNLTCILYPNATLPISTRQNHSNKTLFNPNSYSPTSSS